MKLGRHCESGRAARQDDQPGCDFFATSRRYPFDLMTLAKEAVDRSARANFGTGILRGRRQMRQQQVEPNGAVGQLERVLKSIPVDSRKCCKYLFERHFALVNSSGVPGVRPRSYQRLGT